MKASRVYRLIVKRGGWMPAMLADAGRIDHIEVVDIDSGEVELFWDLPPQQATERARALRLGLEEFDAPEFLARWSTVESE
jgi:hypothetical protein